MPALLVWSKREREREREGEKAVSSYPAYRYEQKSSFNRVVWRLRGGLVRRSWRQRTHLPHPEGRIWNGCSKGDRFIDSRVAMFVIGGALPGSILGAKLMPYLRLNVLIIILFCK